MNSTPHAFPRRKFLATGAAALAWAPLARLRGQTSSPNDEIAMGCVGVGGQGSGNMTNFLNIKGVRVVAVCDVDADKAKAAKAKVDAFYKNQDCKIYAQHRDLLQHPGLDVVSLATPDHWHARIGIDCANAGKDVYGEKPFTWGLAEGRLLVEALKKNNRVWQTGCWQRSVGDFRRFKALIENNTLGKITRFECGTPAGMSVKQHIPADQVAALLGKPPENLDWKTYSAPVGDFPYHPLIHPWNWRWHNSFGGGQLLDWVGHHVDIALWTLGLDGTGPVKMEGTGENGTHDFFNTYVKYSYQGTFADGRVLEVRSDFGGTKFTGEKGWIHVNRGKLEASDREMLRNLPADFDTKPPSHYQNFIDCVRSRKLTVAPAEAAHRAASFGQLAIVAMDTKQPVKWDPKAETVLDNPEQAKHTRLSSRVAG
ncbi:MAG: Gfo/Idh/MocA family oxidoreductase [Verrucomicrobiota bacterium]